VKEQDLIDTSPVIMTDRVRVVFGQIDLPLNTRKEIVLSPDRPFGRPVLFMSDRGSEIVIESVFHGTIAIPQLTNCPVGMFRHGVHLDVVVSEESPLKIILINNGPEGTNVGASLVDSPTVRDSTYHLRHEDLET
jgi:hypothetical protein